MIIKKALAFGLIIFCAHCSKPKPFDELQQIDDPWQGYNRWMFGVNDKIDRSIYQPVARGWVKVTPQLLRKGLHNFLMNVAEPYTTINLLLQGRIGNAHASWARLFTNTTVGVFGFWDAASYFGAPKYDEDFGQTLAVWGVGNGPYFVWPLMGPSNVRDATGFLVHVFSPVNPTDVWATKYDLLYYAVYGLDLRIQLLGSEELLYKQVDPYSFMKNIYTQNRAKLIYDSIDIPKVEEEDLLDFLDEE